MKYIVLTILSIVCLTSFNPVQAQKRKRKIKPVYHGKLQGGYIADKVIPEGYAGFNYFNLGIRKVTGEKIREWGVETFFYKATHGKEVISNGYTIGNKQSVFGINHYQYLMLQQWDFGKLKVQTGPQFSFGYYRNNNQPFTSNNYGTTFNDYKIGGTARIELNYKIDERYSFIVGAQYTVFQFGLRRVSNQNLNLSSRYRVEDFLQFDFLVDRQTAFVGILTQFGKVKINRAKIKKKKEAERKRKSDKLAKKKAKRLKKKEKQKKRKARKKEKNKSKKKK